MHSKFNNSLMKKILILTFLTLFLVSCKEKSETEQAVAAIPVTLKIERFDKLFFETPDAGLPDLQRQYPFLFPKQFDDAVWLEKKHDPIMKELYDEVQKKYSDIFPVKEELEKVVQHIRYYFPEEQTPRVITLVSEMDLESRVIYEKGLVLIALDLYLGKEHRFYEFPEYLKITFEPRQMMPDLVTSFSQRYLQPAANNTLLALMIHEGKLLYLKDVLLPDYSDAEKIAYTDEQVKWVQSNEEQMWRFLIDEDILFDNNPRMAARFIDPAPFTKFGLDIDNASPGKAGAWIGWQIVRSYMKNNDVSLQQLLQMDAKELFENSKYKPKK